MSTTILKAAFPRVVAGARVLARNLELGLERGKILGLTGPNGCGKTITLDCITGLRKTDDAVITLGSERIERLSLIRRWRRGLRRMFQQPALPRETRVSLALDHHRSAGGVGGDSLARDLVEGRAGLDGSRAIGRLSYGERRIVELAAVASSGRVYLLDEPFAGLAESLIGDAQGVVRGLASRGAAVLLVDHSTERLRSVADAILEWPVEESLVRTDPDGSVIEAMLGSGGSRRAAYRARWKVDSILAGARTLVRNIDIRTAPGELVYVVGPNGSGKSSLLRSFASLPQPAGIYCTNSSSDVPIGELHFSPQPPKLIGSRSVAENLDLMWQGAPQERSGRREIVGRLLELAGLSPKLLWSRADRLSGGETAIVSLLGAATSGRPFLLLDEQFESLSERGQCLAGRIVATLLSQGITMIVSSHSVFLDGIHARRVRLGVES